MESTSSISDLVHTHIFYQIFKGNDLTVKVFFVGVIIVIIIMLHVAVECTYLQLHIRRPRIRFLTIRTVTRAEVMFLVIFLSLSKKTIRWKLKITIKQSGCREALQKFQTRISRLCKV
jgi:hypothetical protein